MKPKQELKIFKATSIELLKSLYYKSKAFLVEENIHNIVTEPIQLVTIPFRKIPIVNQSIKLRMN